MFKTCYSLSHKNATAQQLLQNMKLNYHHVLFVVFLLFALIFYCEFVIYYVVLWKCKWPLLPKSNQQNAGYKVGGKPILYAMFLADTHLLGSKLGHWLDKLRREWQMHRGFTTAYHYFQPEVIFFLGDVFDEAKWCGADEFKNYVDRFHSLFPIDRSKSKGIQNKLICKIANTGCFGLESLYFKFTNPKLMFQNMLWRVIMTWGFITQRHRILSNASMTHLTFPRLEYSVFR